MLLLKEPTYLWLWPNALSGHLPVWCGCITERGLPTSPDYQLSWWTICCDGLCWAFDPEERWSSRSWPSVSQSSMKPRGPVSDSPLTVPQRQEEGTCQGQLGESQSHTSPSTTEADLSSITPCLRNALASQLPKTDLMMWNTFSISLLLAWSENVCVNFLHIVAFEV